MKLPEIEKLHKEAIDKMTLMRDGYGPKGFGALVETAIYTSIAKVCNALRKDLAQK